MAPERQAEVAAMIREFASMAPERQAEVAAMIREYTSMAPERRAEVAAMIQEYAAMAPERRWEVWGSLAPERTLAPLTPTLKVPPPAVTTILAAALADRVFEYLSDHPDGTSLTGLEEQFRLGRSAIARVISQLMDDGKIEQRDTLYLGI